MALTEQQIIALKEAARTLVIVGRFGGVGGVHVFEGGNLDEQTVCDAVQPSLGRQYEERFIGRHRRRTVKLVAPLEAQPKTLQRVLPDSPLLKARGGTLREKGEALFERLLQQLDT